MSGRTGTTLRFLTQEMLRDRAMVIATILLAVALILAIGNGLAALAQQRAVIAEAERATAASIRAAEERARPFLSGEIEKPGYWLDPSDVRGFGGYFLVNHTVKPPLALSALTIGSGDVLPRLLRVTPGTLASTAASYDVESPSRLSLGRLDASFVIIFLLPLVIAAAGHGALAADREAGRLPLLAMHGLSPQRVAQMRLGLRVLTLLATGAAAILIPLALGGVALDAGLAAWLAVAVAYGVFWAAVTLVVISFARRASTAAAALGALWLILVLVLPWCISLAAEIAYPAPSRVAQVIEGRDASDEADKARSAALGAYLQDHPELAGSGAKLDPEEFVVRQITTTRLVDNRQAQSDAKFDARMAERQTFVDGLAWLSPPVLAQGAMIELSGTGLTRHRAFVEQTRAYVGELRRYFEPRMLAEDKTFSDWNGWPRFGWNEPSPRDLVRTALGRALGLLVLAGVLFIFATRRLRHTRITARMD